MKKFLAILGLALSAIVLSNTAFANNLIVDTVSVPQCHIKAYNTTDTLTTKTIWYFIFDLDNHTATLTYPRTNFNNIDEPFSTGYNFGFVGLEGIWNQNMYNCWSEVIEKKAPGSNNLFYTALRIPKTFKHEGIDYTVTGIGDNAFNGSNINYIDVPKTVEKIGNYAFANSKIIGQCEASPYQVIPNSVTELGEGIFLNCRNLKRIDIDANVTTIPKGTFDGCFYMDSLSKDSIFEIRFGKTIKTINCDIKKRDNHPENTVNPFIRLAYSSPNPDSIIRTDDFNPAEIWYPSEYKARYDNIISGFKVVKDYNINIDSDNDTIYVDYAKLPIKLNFTQKSYFKNPNSVYNYIYYYPAGGGINFSVNALTGRGANKVRFRMLFDNLDHVWQANKVYQIIRQDTATSYAYLDFNATDTVYEITVRSLDFTRAETKVQIKVTGSIPVQKIILTSNSNIIKVGEQLTLQSRVVDNKNGVSNNQKVVWTTSNDTIATVNQEGVVTALKPGKVDVIATSLDPSASNISGKRTITIKADEQQVTITPQTSPLAIDRKINVSTNGTELTIRSNTPLGKVDIYSLDGRLVKSLNSSINIETVGLPSRGIYVIKSTTQSIKVTL